MIPKTIADRLPADLPSSDVAGWVDLHEGLDNRVGETVILRRNDGGWLAFTRASSFDELSAVALDGVRPLELDVDEWHRDLVVRTADGASHRLDLSPRELADVRSMLDPPEAACDDAGPHDDHRDDQLVMRSAVSGHEVNVSDAFALVTDAEDDALPTLEAKPSDHRVSELRPTSERKTRGDERPAGWGTVGITLLGIGVALYLYMQWFQ